MTSKEALESLMEKYYEMCQDTGNNDDNYQRYNNTSERAIIENCLDVLEILKSRFEFELGSMGGTYFLRMKLNGCSSIRMGLSPKEYEVLKKWFELNKVLLEEEKL